LLKQAATLDIRSQPRHLPVPETTIRAFQITVNSPLPRVDRLKFRLETNSTVVWLHAGGVSLIFAQCVIWNIFPSHKYLLISTNFKINCAPYISA